jgi:hypothetical protein
LSIPAESERLSVEWFRWVVWLSPLLASTALALLWVSGTPAPIPDLRLSAPVVARPGTTIGVRAWQLDGDELGRVSVRAPRVRVELRGSDHRVIASTTLERSRVEGAEGRVDIPNQLDGPFGLVAISEIDGREVSVERTLYVREGVDSKLDAGRTVNAFQAYELGPLRRIDPSRAPSALDPRIEEGACVPDLPCTLTVWVGRWPGTVRARSLTGVRIPVGTAPVSGGFARFPLTVVGPQGRVAVEAIDETGTVTAVREARLPVVPGGMIARAEAAGGDVSVEWRSLWADAPVLVDVFDGHRWVDALSLTRAESRIEGLPPGVWRLQLRQDLFSGNTGAVAFAVIPFDARAVSLAAELVLEGSDERGLDPLAMAVVDGSFEGDPEAAVRALLAVPAFDLVELDGGASSRVGVDEAAAKLQESRRRWAAAFILVLGLVVSIVLFRVEVLARERANRLLESLSSGGVAATTPRGLWALSFLVFVAIAVLALSKSWF